jgi:hypothetical protein
MQLYDLVWVTIHSTSSSHYSPLTAPPAPGHPTTFWHALENWIVFTPDYEHAAIETMSTEP